MGNENLRKPSEIIAEREAKARLIAAAPEMYEALKAALVMNGCHNDEEGRLFNIVRKALAKAEGG